MKSLLGEELDAVAAAAPPGSFVDFAPVHLVTTATLDRLNRVVPLAGLAAQPCVGAYAQAVRPGRVWLGDPVHLA